jgi:hypothetical protein
MSGATYDTWDLPSALAKAYRRQALGPSPATELARALAGEGVPEQGGKQDDYGLGALNSGGGGLGGLGGLMGGESQQSMGGGGFGGFGSMGNGGGAMSPWDALFAGLGRAHGAIDGNDPNSPFVPAGRNPHDSDKALIGAGAPIGGAIGSLFGFGQSGSLAGQNVGATISDVFNGDIHNLGLDVSQNLPPLPGMKQSGWKGLLNGATGLPFGTLLGSIFK